MKLPEMRQRQLMTSMKLRRAEPRRVASGPQTHLLRAIGACLALCWGILARPRVRWRPRMSAGGSARRPAGRARHSHETANGSPRNVLQPLRVLPSPQQQRATPQPRVERQPLHSAMLQLRRRFASQPSLLQAQSAATALPWTLPLQISCLQRRVRRCSGGRTRRGSAAGATLRI